IVAVLWAALIYSSDHRQTEQQKKAEADAAAFTDMTSAQHLAAAQQAWKPDATVDQLDDALHHLKAIPPSAIESTKAKAIEQKIIVLKSKRQQEAANAKAAEARNTALAEAKVKRVLRDQMAKDIENSMLDEGYNVDVSALGNDHTLLRLKWALVSKAMAHQ